MNYKKRNRTEYSKQFYHNKIKINETKMEAILKANRKWKEKNPEKVKKSNDKWNKKNKERLCKNSQENRKRYAYLKKRGHTSDDCQKYSHHSWEEVRKLESPAQLYVDELKKKMQKMYGRE